MRVVFIFSVVDIFWRSSHLYILHFIAGKKPNVTLNWYWFVLIMYLYNCSSLYHFTNKSPNSYFNHFLFFDDIHTAQIFLIFIHSRISLLSLSILSLLCHELLYDYICDDGT